MGRYAKLVGSEDSGVIAVTNRGFEGLNQRYWNQNRTHCVVQVFPDTTRLCHYGGWGLLPGDPGLQRRPQILMDRYAQLAGSEDSGGIVITNRRFEGPNHRYWNQNRAQCVVQVFADGNRLCHYGGWGCLTGERELQRPPHARMDWCGKRHEVRNPAASLSQIMDFEEQNEVY